MIGKHCHCCNCGRPMRKPEVVVRVQRYSSQGPYYEKQVLCHICYSYGAQAAEDNLTPAATPELKHTE